MLSVQRCRELLGRDSARSDAEMERLRDDLYLLANVAIGLYCEERTSAARPSMQEASVYLTQGEQEAAEERAAIMEFEGGVERDEAERRALVGTIGRSSKDASSQD